MKLIMKMIMMTLSVFMMLCVSACSGETESENIERESSEENVMSESVDDEAIGDNTMIMKIGDTKVNVEWEDNQAVEALRDMAKDGDITIQMSMYGGFEQVGSIGQSLPRDDKQTTTSSGDIVLYSGNQMVVFYGSNSWSYTRLGHISDKDEAEMADLLSNGDVTITISRE
ncbi:cyclophilin-like fold protein [Agathobacter ruminis]|uniref:cyclophilin-like fold protein n=2 Tax=Agathobacter ruminis TaxID=1712665 RepID=UPI0016713F0E|nr:cyclophilin-like fold protein [Agathobacter ruminis]MDC7302452.1 cyclophilin-like fold protein [Agathobacter ruminis]